MDHGSRGIEATARESFRNALQLSPDGVLVDNKVDGFLLAFPEEPPFVDERAAVFPLTRFVLPQGVFGKVIDDRRDGVRILGVEGHRYSAVVGFRIRTTLAA